MAKAIYEWTDNGQSVTIYNQGPYKYSKELWEHLKAMESMDDDELAKTLNNK